MRILTALSVFVMCFALATEQGKAQSGSQPLPALPNQAVLDKIIKETGGPADTPLGVPVPIANQILSIVALVNPSLAGNTKVFDLQGAVYYTSVDSGLKQIVVPLVSTPNDTLSPNMQTPDDGLPAQIVGAVYELGKSPAVLVVVWKDKDKTKKPVALRFYSVASGKAQYTTPYKLAYRKLKGDKSGKAAPSDQGVSIASRETCFTIGLNQACYAPDKHVPDSKASSDAGDASQQLTTVYALKVDFDLEGALPDLAGVNWRTQCADKLGQIKDAAALTNVSECGPTTTITAVKQIQPGQPIGLIRVLKDLERVVYDMNGNTVGKLPVGDYLVMDATPNITEPGAPAVLMLVNADGKNHYLIPSAVVEGFGESDDNSINGQRGQAAIKDASIGFHSF